MKRELFKNEIRLLSKSENIPYDLLLLADETKETIDRYVNVSEVFVYEISGVISGVYVFYAEDNIQIEIENIAVATALQGAGIGSFLLNDAERRAIHSLYQAIIVGTPESSNILLQFYAQAGFIKYDRRVNFYIDNYREPIIENNVKLKDMIMLK
mgnify:FL=1